MGLLPTKRKPVIAQWSDLARWDYKSARAALFAQLHPDFVPLGNYANEVTELVDPRKEPDKEWPIYGVSNESGVFLSSHQKGSDFNSKYKRICQDYFFHNPTRANVGSLGRVQDVPPDAITSPEYQVWKPRPELLPSFTEILIKTDFFLDQIECHRVGGVKERLFVQNLFEIPVPIPPLPIQQKIVAHWAVAQLERSAADTALTALVTDLHSWLVKQTKGFDQVTRSKVFFANYQSTQQWDVKAGRAAAFITANPNFIRLGDYTEECTETVRPWEDPERKWPIYGVNNQEGIFLGSMQLGKDFNAPYKRIDKDYFFHNPTRANVGSLGIVPEVPTDAITSPEYQVWRLKGGFLPDFIALMLRTDYFLALVDFNRVGGVKQRMYYANLAEIRLPECSTEVQINFAKRRQAVLTRITEANQKLAQRKKEIEQMILGTRPEEAY